MSSLGLAIRQVNVTHSFSVFMAQLGIKIAGFLSLKEALKYCKDTCKSTSQTHFRFFAKQKFSFVLLYKEFQVRICLLFLKIATRLSLTHFNFTDFLSHQFCGISTFLKNAKPNDLAEKSHSYSEIS